MKAIIADVDDTICPSTQPIAPAMAEELGRIADSGRILAFISGGTMDQLLGQLLPGLNRPFHVLAATGTHYVKVGFEGGKAVKEEVYCEVFPEEQKQEIRAAFEALIAKHAIKTMTTAEDQLQDRGTQMTLSAIGRHAPDAAKRAFDPDGSKRRAWIEELKASLGDKYCMRVGGTSSIDITASGRDKAWGIARFLDINKIKPSEVVFFGDKLGPEGNDYPARQIVDCIQVRNESHTLEILKNFLPSL